MTFAEIFASDFLIRVVIRALVVGILVSICSSVLGVILVLKRQSMIGDGLSHVGFLGLALAAVAGVGATFSMEISIPVVIIAAILIQRLSKNDGKMNGDAACAVVSTGAVAKSIGGSQRLLEMNFKKVIGHSIHEEINLVRLAKVKDMLAKTSHSFDSIAAFCGFHNTNHLRNLFKRKFRMTLSDWRKKHPK